MLKFIFVLSFFQIVALAQEQFVILSNQLCCTSGLKIVDCEKLNFTNAILLNKTQESNLFNLRLKCYQKFFSEELARSKMEAKEYAENGTRPINSTTQIGFFFYTIKSNNATDFKHEFVSLKDTDQIENQAELDLTLKEIEELSMDVKLLKSLLEKAGRRLKELKRSLKSTGTKLLKKDKKKDCTNDRKEKPKSENKKKCVQDEMVKKEKNKSNIKNENYKKRR